MGYIYSKFRGAWVVQSVKRPTLDFGSGHDFIAHEIKPCVGLCTDSTEPGWDSLSPSQNKQINLKKQNKTQFIWKHLLVSELTENLSGENKL